MDDDLPCRLVSELVTDYLERALAPALHDRVERHLLACADCATYLAQMRSVVALTGSLRDDDVPPALVVTLLSAYREWSARQGRRPSGG